MSREAMQQALEALEALKWRGLPSFVKDATTALRQALAEPEQEPVAWIFVDDTGMKFVSVDRPHKDFQPLYTAAPTSQPEQEPVGINGLTEAETDASASVVWLVRKPEQEPVAWLYRDSWGTMKLSQIMPPPVGAFPVYTAPTPRKPLTDEEIALIVGECAASAYRHDDFSFARAVIAAYEKKQGGQHE